MVFLSSRISPFTSTVILRERSPRATAVVTSAMLRTCVVRLAASRLTLSVRSFQVPATPGHHGLAAEAALGADLACDARHLGRERAQLIHHRVDGFLELQDLAAHIDRDLLRQVAVGHGDRDVGDVAHLVGQVAGHRVHALGQVLPDARDLADLRLAAELAVGADLARHARHLGGEHAELLDHGVDDGGRAQELALQRPAVDVEAHGYQQVALRHRLDASGHLGGRPQEIVDQGVDRVLHPAPGARREADAQSLARPALLADDLAHLLELLGEVLIGRDDIVKGVGDFAEQPGGVARHAHREIAHAHGLQRAQEILELAPSASRAVGERSVILDDFTRGFAHAHVTPSVSPGRGRIPTGCGRVSAVGYATTNRDHGSTTPSALPLPLRLRRETWTAAIGSGHRNYLLACRAVLRISRGRRPYCSRNITAGSIEAEGPPACRHLRGSSVVCSRNTCTASGA